MGVPKRKWTSEEESALKAGVAKHKPGNWLTILRDPEFATVLHLRSNVDLKDKWRNLKYRKASGHGYGHRDRLGTSKSQPIGKTGNISAVSKGKLDKERSIQDSPTILALSLQKCSKRPISRVTSNLKPPYDSCGAKIVDSCGAKIVEYIEVVTAAPADGLPPGWIKEIITKQYSTQKRSDLFYTDPLSGYVFRSKLDALRYLETGEIETCVIKRKKKEINEEQTDKMEKKPADREAQVVPPQAPTNARPPESVQKQKRPNQTVAPPPTKASPSESVQKQKRPKPEPERKLKQPKQMVARRKKSERIILNKLKRPAFGEGGPGTSIDNAVNLD